MYGMLNRAIKDLVLQRHGAEAWTLVREKAGVEDDLFLSMEQYPDELTYRLVGAASEVLGASPDAILEAFGEYWITYTAEAGYGEILRAAGRSLEEMLGNLDQLHTRVRLGMPHLRPPSFRVTKTDDGALILHYSSTRPGLAPCVVGLVKGLAKRFGEEVTVEHLSHRSGELHQDDFRIVRKVPA